DSAGTLDTLVGRFTTRWTRDSLGNTRVQWAVLSSRSQQAAVVRAPRRSKCVDPEFFRAQTFQKSTRFAITLFPAGFFTNAGASVESAVISQGWRDSLPGTTPPTPGPVSDLTRLAAVRFGGARYRFSDRLVGELIIGALARGSTRGRNDRRSSEL